MEWKDAKKQLEADRAVLLDIRSLPEHIEKRIPGSIHLNFFELDAVNARKTLGKQDKLVLVYCRNGLHSRPAADKLTAYGYHAVDMGGVDDYPWELEGTFI